KYLRCLMSIRAITAITICGNGFSADRESHGRSQSTRAWRLTHTSGLGRRIMSPASGKARRRELSARKSPPQSASWQHLRRLLASKSKHELLHLIRDLYALTTDNKDFIHAQVLTPKRTVLKARQPKQPPSSTSKVIPKIRQLATIAREL